MFLFLFGFACHSDEGGISLYYNEIPLFILITHYSLTLVAERIQKNDVTLLPYYNTQKKVIRFKNIYLQLNNNMVKIETTHKLLDDELSTLRQLIGKKINAIYCSGASLWSHSNFYEFNDTINLRIDKKEGFIAISAIFDETKFGDNFIKININQVKDPIGIKKNEEGNLLLPIGSLT